MIRRNDYSPIGIDITTRCIRAVQLHRRRGVWRLHAAAAVPRDAAPEGPWTPPSEAEHERLVGVLQRRAFEGSKLVLAVPADRMVESVIELPPRSSGAPLNMLAAAELGRVHKMDAATLQVAYWEIPAAARGAGGGAVEYMVAGCTEQAALELIDPFERVGLCVEALDVRALSLQRACAASLGTGGSIDAILCMGWNHTTLLFVVDGVVTFQRALEGVNGKTLAIAAAQKLHTDPASAVGRILRHAACAIDTGTPTRREMEREVTGTIAAHVEAVVAQFAMSCSYISRRYPDRALKSIVVTGEFGAIPGVVERLERSDVAVRRLGLADAVSVNEGEERAVLGTEFIAPLGLALRPMRSAA